MRTFKYLLSFVLVASIVASCSTSNDVVNNRRIQKRKYTKGFFVQKKESNKKLEQNGTAEANQTQVESPATAIYQEKATERTAAHKIETPKQSKNSIQNEVADATLEQEFLAQDQASTPVIVESAPTEQKSVRKQLKEAKKAVKKQQKRRNGKSQLIADHSNFDAWWMRTMGIDRSHFDPYWLASTNRW